MLYGTHFKLCERRAFSLMLKHGTTILNAVNVEYRVLARHLLIPQGTAKPDLLGLPSEVEFAIDVPLF